MDTTAPTRPVIRLKPKGPAQLVRFGAPWVFTDNLVMDRRSRALAPGTLVELQDDQRNPLALCGFNPNSKIGIRVLGRDMDAEINQAWFAEKLSRALVLRNDLFDAPFYRLIHAEGDGLPGVIIDRFGDVAVIQPNAAWADLLLAELAAALAEVTRVAHIYANTSGRARKLEGLEGESRWLLGGHDKPVPVPMNDATYLADITGGQKTGLFYDQRPNHAFAARLARGRDVLDVFSHVGGFGLAALAGGAKSALAVDASAGALALAEGGAAASGHAETFGTRRGDAFEIMTSLAEEGASYGLVVCDPPAFAPAKPALEAGLRAYERVARLGAGLVAPGGYLVLCSCSHAADLAKFRAACLRGLGKAGRSGRILHEGAAGPDHPVHPHLAESSYLKAIFLALE